MKAVIQLLSGLLHVVNILLGLWAQSINACSYAILPHKLVSQSSSADHVDSLLSVFISASDTEPVVRHPEFRLFACMNPATDVGKKDLPAGVRSRFTEFFVDELENKQDLR